METVAGTKIGDFSVRGNYFNQRTLLLRRSSHSSKKRRYPFEQSWVFSSGGGPEWWSEYSGPDD
jgi:hypothetical protein